MLFLKARARAVGVVPLTTLLLAIVPGARSEARVKVKYSWEQKADMIAAEIAPRLAILRSGFDRERRSQPAAKLLDRTEASLMKILKAPELAPMRDAVKEEFRQARTELRATRSGKFPDGRLTVVPAAFRRPPPSPTEDSSALDRIARLLAKLTGMAEESHISRDVCVVSRPQNGARVLLYPPSYPRGTRETHTTEKIHLFLGQYAYKAQSKDRPWIRCEPDRKGLPSGDCAFLDLLNSEQAIVSCDFSLKSCVLASGTTEETCP